MLSSIQQYVLRNWDVFGRGQPKPKKLSTVQRCSAHGKSFARGRIVHFLFNGREPVPLAVAKFCRSEDYASSLVNEFETARLLYNDASPLVPEAIDLAEISGRRVFFQAFFPGISPEKELTDFVRSARYSEEGLRDLVTGHFADAAALIQRLGQHLPMADDEELFSRETGNYVERYLETFVHPPDEEESIRSAHREAVSRLAERFRGSRLVDFDFIPSNLLKDGDGALRVIDWEFAHTSSLTFVEPLRFVFYYLALIYHLRLAPVQNTDLASFVRKVVSDGRMWLSEIVGSFLRETTGRDPEVTRDLFFYFFIVESLLQAECTNYLSPKLVAYHQKFVELFAGADESPASLPGFQATFKERVSVSALHRLLTDQQDQATEMQRMIGELRTAHEQRGAALAEKDERLADKDALLSEKDASLAEKDSLLVEKDALLAEKDILLTEKDASLAGKDAQLRDLQMHYQLAIGSLGYRLLERARRVINWLAPLGTRRRGVLRLFRQGLRIIRREGVGTFLRRAVRVWRWAPRLFAPARPAEAELPLDHQYQLWLQAHALTPARTGAIWREATRLSYRPLVSVIMPVYNPDPRWLRDAIESVRAQLYDNWELCIADDGSSDPGVRAVLEDYARTDERIKVAYLKENQGISGASNAALAVARGEFVGLLDHDDELKPDALYEVVKLLNEQPDLDFIYTDEDKRRPDGRLGRPFFKPDWSPDLLLSVNYVPHFAVYRKRMVDEVGGLRSECDLSQDYDLALRVTERTEHIGHIPLPLYTWRMAAGSASAKHEDKLRAMRAARRALAEAMQRRGIEADILDGSVVTTYRVRCHIQGQPLVSIIIPTRDRVDLLSRCIASIERNSTYRNYEIVIVDNESKEEVTFEYLNKLSHRCLAYPGTFCYAAMMNFAVGEAAGEYVLFLNNDTEVITGEWIEAMLEHSQRPEVAATGARLLYPDGRVQHEGIIIGLGGSSAGNVNHGGYFGLDQLVHNVSAVTGACMMTRRDVFDRLGGLEENLGVAFNDVDYCLRAREQGYLIVYTPYALLYHHESGTRGKLHPMEDELFFRKRWGNPGQYRDPYYNPNLSLNAPFTIKVD